VRDRLALVGRPAPTDSTVAAKLRAGGAVILGKTTCPNGRLPFLRTISGWSGRGGQTNNPYGINRTLRLQLRSGAAASANFAVLTFRQRDLTAASSAIHATASSASNPPSD